MMIDLILLGVAVALFAAMRVCHEVGRWFGQRELAKDPDATRSGTGVIDAGIFGLLGLLLAFSFSGAASRLDVRRAQLIAEANAIGTAYMRLDLLPPAQEPELRELFRQYVDSRIAAFQKMPDMSAVAAEMEHGSKIQSDIWASVQKAVHASPDPQTGPLVLSPLSEMFSANTTRTYTMLAHTPVAIVALLIFSALLSSMLAAYGGADRPRRKLHMFVFNLMVAVTIYVILDLDYPRIGLIRLDVSDKAMIDLRHSMK